MKRYITSLIVLVLAGMMASTPLWAQRGMGKMQNYMRPFGPGTVETVSGEVTDVVYVKKSTNMAGVHIMVKTDKETIPVHLGPVWYIEKQQPFEKGDRVTVTGSRVTFNKVPALVASIVVRGEMTLQLRDKNGYPAWRGWRKSRTMNN
ncbi:hypothetical protein NC796_18920 [Aliifodinibius sp. S!AR15-10]|uniref:hypothetical protein n=1 Tax=Aliifodinibius sp. S!AR15-10 TaxID=2950437 RepID=UPI0028636692|nr:hypothetical protein [Aliifodinibius sp. S!AR15-10]MDR8393235.1 hypothetical protein [Aliifodinibius sp. S!AR15-10]